jgi:hypothetical protein
VSRGRAAPAAILALAAVLLAACGRPDHERAADTAYGAGRYADALAEYRAVSKGKPRARVWAKLGAAALHAGELRESAEAFLRLAADDPTRADEAAEGLESVARAAERAGNDDVLREVVTGLQAVAPGRTTTAYALVLAQRANTDTAELVALLPSALAAASAPETVDSLLTRYARALEATAGCSTGRYCDGRRIAPCVPPRAAARATVPMPSGPGRIRRAGSTTRPCGSPKPRGWIRPRRPGVGRCCAMRTRGSARATPSPRCWRSRPWPQPARLTR